MAWTTPTNFTASSVVASSKLNDEVVANLLHLFAMLGSEAAWTTYTPTNTNITVGNGTQTARYIKIGRLVHVRYTLVWGNSTSFGGVPSIGLPFAATGAAALTAAYLDSTTRLYVGVALVSGSAAALQHTESGNSGSVNGTNPFTWTTNDTVYVTGIYESSS